MSAGELFAILAVCGVIGGLIASSRGASAGVGFFLGFLLGIIGIIISLFLKPSTEGTRECPHCKERMKVDASVCPHCHRESPPWVWRDGSWFVTNENGSTYRYDPSSKSWVAP